MKSSVITPFNTFSALSFILLAGVALLVRTGSVSKVGLAAASALIGFLLIAMFLLWTLFEREE